jgi:hypothetical protein
VLDTDVLVTVELGVDVSVAKLVAAPSARAAAKVIGCFILPLFPGG